jgi:CheY-like chemotaxis protein
MQKKALIVDDSKIARRALRNCLPENWPYEIIEAGGGAEGLELCAEHRPEVMFLDLTMPEIDGLEVLERLRHELIRPIVIMVSADIQPTSRSLAMLRGAFEFLNKPTSRDEIAHVLDLAGLL